MGVGGQDVRRYTGRDLTPQPSLPQGEGEPEELALAWVPSPWRGGDRGEVPCSIGSI